MVVRNRLAISVPEVTYARILSSSRILVKQHIGAAKVGVLDADCRGDWSIIFLNYVDDQFHIQQGDGIAQLIL